MGDVWGLDMSDREMNGVAAFDGIICLGGEDWWYHNRGHFDFQIMRRLARRWPVLFVNSIGVRMPKLNERRVFAQRITRKLKSLSRGLIEAEPGFFVFSPFNVPGQKVSEWALGPQIRLAARRAGIKRPLLWVHCPAGAALIGQLGEVKTVLQRTDRFEAFPEADPNLVGQLIDRARDSADLVVYAAPHLMAEEAHLDRGQVLIDHGVDLDRFAAAGEAVRAGRLGIPADLAAIPGPRVGFIGGLDAHTFDPPLFVEVARRLPGHQFVLVGGSSLPEGWCDLANVHMLGRKPYDEVAAYQAGMDVLIMPWNDSEWIKACNPIKLKEYLAVGRPIVTTDFVALERWRDLVSVAAGPDQFAAAIAAATGRPVDFEERLRRLAGESWDAKADLLAGRLAGEGPAARIQAA